MKRIKVFLLNGILLTSTSLLLKSVGMFFGIYISNKISIEAVGIYQLIMTIYLFFITLSSAGINITISKIISEKIAFREDYYIKDIMKKSIIYSIFIGIICAILLYILSPIISFNLLHSKVSSLPLKIIAISLPFITISCSIDGYFSAVRNIKKSAITDIIEQFIKIFIIYFLLNSTNNLSIENTCIFIVIGDTISEIISCILLLFFYKLDINKKIQTSYTNKKSLKQILKINLPIASTSYIRSFLSTSKQLLIPNRLKASGISYENAISNYGKINGMVMPLILFPCNFISSFSFLLIPEFSYMHAKKSKDKINYSINKILKFSFIFSFLVLGIFWCFSKELSTFIYPHKELSSFIKILSILIVFMYVDNVVDSILKGLNKQVASMIINILDLFISILLIYFLLPIKGLSGYILVLFISEIFNFTLSIIVLYKTSHFKIDLVSWFLKPLIAITLSNFIFQRFTCSNITSLILEIIFYIICYFIFLILVKGFVKNDFVCK